MSHEDSTARRLVPLGELGGTKGKPGEREKACSRCGKPGFYFCPECLAAHEEEDRQRRATDLLDGLESYVARVAKAQGLGQRFINHRLETLQPGPRRVVEGWVKALDEGRRIGFGLFGTTGGHKTGAAAEAFKEFIRRRIRRLAAGQAMLAGPWPSWNHWPTLVSELWTVKREFGWDYGHCVQELTTTPLLVLDDMGQLQEERTIEAGFPVKAFTEIIGARYDNDLPVIWTSNLDPKRLEDLFGPQNLSRLRDLAPSARIVGRDQRG